MSRASKPRLVISNSPKARKSVWLYIGAFLLLLFAGLAGRGFAPAIDDVKTQALPGIADRPDHTARNIGICSGSNRVNCVVDGDTLWLAGRKIRISNIDAPEMNARCDKELDLARAATQKLRSLVTGQDLIIEAEGNDRYGRLLARVSTSSGDVGEALVNSGFAVRWQGRKADVSTWCGVDRG